MSSMFSAPSPPGRSAFGYKGQEVKIKHLCFSAKAMQGRSNCKDREGKEVTVMLIQDQNMIEIQVRG